MCAKRKTGSNKRLFISVSAIAVLGLIAALAMRSEAVTYESVNSKLGGITTYYSFSGNIDTKNRQSIIAERDIQIAQLNVKEGDSAPRNGVLLKTAAGEEIRSKINGIAVAVAVEENSQVMAGTKLLDVVDYNNLVVTVKVDEYDITALAKDKEATIKIGALNKEIKGNISSISQQGQVLNGLTYFTANIDLERDESLKIGMSAEVKVISAEAGDIVILPMTAIQFDANNRPYVLKKGTRGEAVKTEITTGLNDGTNVEITSGVSSGETILYTKVNNTMPEGMVFSGERAGKLSGGGRS